MSSEPPPPTITAQALSSGPASESAPTTTTTTASSTTTAASPVTTSTTAAAAAAPPNPLAAHPVFTKTAPNDPEAVASPTSGSHGPGQPGPASSPATELSGAKLKLKSRLRHFADFPSKGIDFVDIMPLFSSADSHETLLSTLVLQTTANAGPNPDVIVGLDARGFLFGPGLALRLGVPFAPVRKKGKLPGPCVTAAYEKEYGTDFFQMQEDAIKVGQKVLIVDDIIATGGSAKAAADLVKQLGGSVIGFLFILEIPGLNGREKLGDTPTTILLEDA